MSRRVLCNNCGRSFVSGTSPRQSGLWRLCPACRGGPPQEPAQATSQCSECGRPLRGRENDLREMFGDRPMTADDLLPRLRDRAAYIDPESAELYAGYSARDWDAGVGLALKA